MNRNILAILDSDGQYAKRLQQYLSEKKGNRFIVYSFSDINSLLEKFREKKQEKPEILLVAEGCFEKELTKIGTGHIFILNETGLNKYPDFVNLNKYQSAEELFQQILLKYAEMENEVIPRFYGKKKAEIIGVYTPIGRCGQTGFSLTLSRFLGTKGRVLYINFEQYSGFSRLFLKGYIKDISDLVYYFTYSREKFLYWLEGIVERFAEIEYIPPVIAGTGLCEVSPDIWQEMLEMISIQAGYDYIVLDICDCVQNVFSILEQCERIYTITKQDFVSEAKLSQFRQVIKGSRYLELEEKIIYLKIPSLKIRAGSMEEMTYGELMKYVKEIAEDTLNEPKNV